MGPRGSGKSEYCQRLLANQPDFSVVSRDSIVARLCGTEHPDAYSGGIEVGMMIMHRQLCRKLSTWTGLRLILDCWTGESSERKSILEKLHQYGADQVTALYFVTPPEVVSEWFWKKPGIAKMEEMISRQSQGLAFYIEDAPKRDYQLFHRYARKIDSDGFNKVIRVNPLDPLIVL